MTLTARQSEALDILLDHTNVLLYGGARSGKTALAMYFFYYCAMRFPDLRVLVVRRFGTDIRASIWNETMPKVARLLDLRLGKDYKTNEMQMTMDFPNGSSIICAGLDDKERVDKVLGTEYGAIYVNESQDVPWNTVKTIRTRLAQRIAGFRNRFVCDLNPTSTAHWTYSLWFDGVQPDTKAQVRGRYGKIQMNPQDNAANLADGFIEDQLEGLTGEARKRFLLGEYSSNSELQVFQPKAWFDDEGFFSWAKGKWGDMEVTGALDLGFEDADAFVQLAYIDGEPDVWLLGEYKGVRNNISDLANAIKRMNAQLWEKYPFKAHKRDEYQIWTDTGGLGRKTAQELADNFELPIRAAYKRDKDVGLFYVQDDVNAGRLHLRKDGPFADECRKVVWRRDRDTDMVTRVLDDDTYHPDLLDAVIYAYRFLMKHGNTAMMGRVSVVEPGSRPQQSYFDIQAEVMKALGQEEAIW